MSINGYCLFICFVLAVGLCLIVVWRFEERSKIKSLRRSIRRLRRSVRANRKTPELKILRIIQGSIKVLRFIAPDNRKHADRFTVEIWIAVDLANIHRRPERFRKLYPGQYFSDETIRAKALLGLEAIDEAIANEIRQFKILKAHLTEESVDRIDHFDEFEF